MPIPFALPLATAAISGIAGYAGSKLAGGRSSSPRGRGGRGSSSTPDGGSLQRVSTLARPQIELQNRVINEGLRNLGLLTGGGQRLEAPSLPTLPPVPGLSPLPGYSNLNLPTTNYGPLAQLYQGNKYSFEPIAQQARHQFATQTVPSIAERFAGLGALSSSGFNRQLAQAATDLERELAALRSQYGIQERGQTFQERQAQNAQNLQREQLLNQLVFGRQGAQTGLEQLRNQLRLQTNEQALARQQQQAQQSLGLGGLGLQRFGTQASYELGRRGQQIGGLGNLLQLGLQPSFNTVAFPRQPGFAESLANPILQGIGYGLPGLIGSGLSSLGSYFGG